MINLSCELVSSPFKIFIIVRYHLISVLPFIVFLPKYNSFLPIYIFPGFSVNYVGNNHSFFYGSLFSSSSRYPQTERPLHLTSHVSISYHRKHSINGNTNLCQMLLIR